MVSLRWDNDHAAKELLNTLSGDARHCLSHLNDWQLSDLNELMNALNQIYRPEHFRKELQSECKTMKFDETTSLVAFYSKLLSLYRRAKPHIPVAAAELEATEIMLENISPGVYAVIDSVVDYLTGWQIAAHYDRAIARRKGNGYFKPDKTLYTGPHGHIKVDDLRKEGILVYQMGQVPDQTPVETQTPECELPEEEASLEGVNYTGSNWQGRDGNRDKDKDGYSNRSGNNYRGNKSRDGDSDRDGNRGSFKGRDRDRGNRRDNGFVCDYHRCPFPKGHTSDRCRTKANDEYMMELLKESERRQTEALKSALAESKKNLKEEGSRPVPKAES